MCAAAKVAWASYELSRPHRYGRRRWTRSKRTWEAWLEKATIAIWGLMCLRMGWRVMILCIVTRWSGDDMGEPEVTEERVPSVTW
ncbi:hypothetical protein EJ04DRAFT_298686 [Polyplosphaeria fusca]|uniref:Uncharacterized protein n=1 Tax=Polyplosphaeria fusca TaxID=682080 RepID=A0A9P4QY42_9PLEO|nr:hypothetical protein EJ04DRAFT_298686 [Polyplosphaeria fusca]